MHNTIREVKEGYDNGANMAGIDRGAQPFILGKNPQAMFSSCSAHSLTQWKVLQETAHYQTSDTHWSTRIDVVKPLVKRLREFYMHWINCRKNLT